MIAQLSQVGVECPICVRRVQFPKQYLQQESGLRPAVQPTVLLVEYRDEVFARLAMDLAQAGMRVVRAKTAAEAIPLFARHAPALVLANLDMPDQSGWLLAAKLRFICPHTRVWLYHTWTSRYAEGMATFLKADELLEYGGDLLGLSEAVIALVTMHQRRGHARKALRTNEGKTAA